MHEDLLLLEIANIALTEEQTIKLFRTIDADSSGEVRFLPPNSVV